MKGLKNTCESYLEFPEGCGLQKKIPSVGIYSLILSGIILICTSLQSVILNPSLFFEIKLFLLTFTTDSNFKRQTFCCSPTLIKIKQCSSSSVLSGRWLLPFDTSTHVQYIVKLKPSIVSCAARRKPGLVV